MSKIKTSIEGSIKFPSVEFNPCNIKELDANLQLTEHIKLYEWANNRASDAVKMIINSDIAEFAEMVEELRLIYGKPFNFNSAYRTKSFNKSCGGSSNSLHLQCRACDIKFTKCSDKTFNLIDENWQKICAKHGKIGGINRYTNMIHIDNHEDYFGNKSYTHRDYRGTSSDV